MKILVDGQTLGTPELHRGIGKVFLEILYHIVDGDIEHDWYIAVRDQAHFDLLKPHLRRWMQPVVLPALAASGDQLAWCQAYGRQLEEIARSIGAEVYWNPNPLMPNVHYPLGFKQCPVVVTLHDLIPRLMPERFQPLFGESLWLDYLARCDEMAGNNSWIVAVSEASTMDYLGFYAQSKPRVSFAHHASDYSLLWPYIQGDRLSGCPYVLYVGGFDPRKNMDNALRAFAAFSKQQKSEGAIRFKVVCAYDQAAKEAYFSLACELGVADRLDLTGYVDDEELGFLFRNASVFFFPSLYEGFGLPVLDALACGLPVVASANSSIPEVGGKHVTYCDPSDIADMVRALTEAWLQRDPMAPSRAAAVAHARTFRWEKAAAHYLQIFKQAACCRNVPRNLHKKKPKVAYLSPWPPQKTGVADYSYQLMPELLKRMDITLFAESPGDCVSLAGLNIETIDDYPNQAAHFDGAIYHLGNGLTHLKIYEHAWRIPGVVVLHDYNIHPFFQHGLLGTALEPLYEEAIKEYGPEGWNAWEDYQRSGKVPDTWQFAMSQPIARRSLATIVHSRWVAQQLDEVGRVLRVHLGAQPPPATTDLERITIRRRLNMDDNCVWVGVFGFINQHKRVDSIIAAVGNMHRSGYPVRLLIVGEVNDARVNLETLCNQHGINDITQHIGYADADTFLDCIKAVDVVVNLRYPTMGESSASMFHALALGKPMIVSDYGTFSEIPDKVAWKADPFTDEIEVLTLFIENLAKSSALRNSMSFNSQLFISEKALFANVANIYFQAIEHPMKMASG